MARSMAACGLLHTILNSLSSQEPAAARTAAVEHIRPTIGPISHALSCSLSLGMLTGMMCMNMNSHHWLMILVMTILVVLSVFVCPCRGQPSSALRIELLRREAYQQSGSEKSIQLWQKVLQLDPRHLEARVMLGTMLIAHPSPKVVERGILLLEECHDASKVTPVLDMTSSPQAIMITSLIGRYRNQRQEYAKAKRFTEIAFNASKIQSPPDGDICLAMQLASLLDYFPTSVEKANQALTELNDRMDAVLHQRPDNMELDEDYLSDSIGPAAADPYVHCLRTLFQLSFYYRADVAALASKHYQMAALVWPDLVWTAPHVIAYNELLQTSQGPYCEKRRIRLGIIAGVLIDGHPVTEDFSGVLSRLNRNIFDVTYIYLPEQNVPIANFTKEHPHKDRILVLHKLASDTRRGAWIKRLGQKISSLKLDMILYLDLTMSTYARRLGMMRLAPVQLNTHGHPITSGHPRWTVQYYVSWAEAELPEAQMHYTESLKLVPKGKIHQYYERRVLEGQISRLDGAPFGHLVRGDFGLPETGTVYMNMQKPHKLQPEFDRLVCGIMKKDLEGHVVLHEANPKSNQAIFRERLTTAGCDLARIHFLPSQPHHRLLGLIGISTIVLDSYPAGGCTTTREVLEMGKVVVTLPARLLGGRWTLGYYNILEVDDHVKKAAIAETEEEYINLAVALGTDPDLRASVEASIRKTAPRLFGRTEAVREWEKILLEAAPLKMCPSYTIDDEL